MRSNARCVSCPSLKSDRSMKLRNTVEGEMGMESKPRILVVDDYTDGREMVAAYLASDGFQVIEARDGQEAIELATSWRPSIILMDLQMPRIDGWEATR